MTKKSIKIEVDTFGDGRLKHVVRFTKSSNFWEHDDGTYTWVPTKEEVEHLRESLEAIDAYNTAKFIYKYFKGEQM
jgi:hypothetical protein